MKMRIVKITRRKCSDKMQPNIREGFKYVVQGEERLKDGTKVLLLADLEKSTKKHVKTMRCNAERFEWCEYTEEMRQEEAFRREVKEGYEQLLKKFTFEEHMRICFIPHVIIHCAWHYADEVLKEAAANKISATIKLSQAVRMLRRTYDEEISRDLDRKHQEDIDKKSEMFRQTFLRDFIVMEITLRNEILKVAPDDKYVDLRMYAYAGMLLLNYYARQTEECDKLIEERMGREHRTILNPRLMALRDCLDAYTGDVKIDLKHNVELCMRIFGKNLGMIDFELGKEPTIK